MPLKLALLILSFLLQFASCSSDSAVECSGERWVGAWAAAPSDADSVYSEQTMRLVLTPGRGGEEVRIKLSNRLSASPLNIAAVYLGKQKSGPDLVSGSNTPLSFQGKSKVTIKENSETESDSVIFPFEAFEKLAVSLYISGTAESVTGHNQAMQTSYFSEPGSGDLAYDENGIGFTISTTRRPIITGINVLVPAGHSVVAAIGDSITDGASEAVGAIDADVRYPDFLARRLLEEDSLLSAINLGIGGNRVLEDGVFPWAGPSLLSRLEADVLSRDDVTNVILLEGINDLGMSPSLTAAELINGLEEAVSIIKSRQEDLQPIKVFIGTILPAGSTADPIGYLYRQTESRRQEVNEHIRTSGIGDGYIDFDRALMDPSDHTVLAPEYDGGDGLHPSPLGYERMAQEVDISELQARDCSY